MYVYSEINWNNDHAFSGGQEPSFVFKNDILRLQKYQNTDYIRDNWRSMIYH